MAGFNEAKLKVMVREKWLSSPDCWPVKAISLARTKQLEQQYGSPLTRAAGYITVARAVLGKTPEQMEAILGMQPGYFSSGVNLLRLDRLPNDDEYGFRGYSQLPGGKEFDGEVIRTPGVARPTFVPADGTPFIPGLGVEQWELLVPIPATEMKRLAPGEKFMRLLTERLA